MSKYQTLEEFINLPFNKREGASKKSKYDERYRKYISENLIRVVGYTEIEDSTYVHVKVPSESKKDEKYEYDVVIRFFPPTDRVRFDKNIKNYYIQFFSNSPGFIYKYAVQYKKYDYLIEAMYDKLDPKFMDKLPEKANANMELSYDSSIYFACKYLIERRFGIHGLARKKSNDQFFHEITNFESVKVDSSLVDADRKLKKQFDLLKQKKKENDPHFKRNTTATTSTSKDQQSIRRIDAKKTTIRGGTGLVKKGTKITAKKTTRRK